MGVTVEIPAPDYSLFDTERDGKPAVVVFNTTALAFTERDLFPWHLEITIRAAKTGKNGMPTPAECAVLDELGDAIEDALDKATTSLGALNVLFVARVTCDSQRELVFRVHDPEVANAVLQRTTADLTVREWGFTMSGDEDWEQVEVFESLAASTRS